MDDRARGAADLLAAMHRAGQAFRAYGYAQYLAHQSVTWKHASGLGHAVEPFATVGVTFQLHDKIDRWVSLSVGLWVRDGDFVVQGDAMVDDPLPIRGGGGNQRFLRELPEVRTGSLDEAIGAVEQMTTTLCGYHSVLDDLQVPRTDGRSARTT
jgi:hypothetical protein